jgi:hypothetical protein
MFDPFRRHSSFSPIRFGQQRAAPELANGGGQFDSEIPFENA